MMISPHFTGHSLLSSPSSPSTPLVQLSPSPRQAVEGTNNTYPENQRDSDDIEPISRSLDPNSDSASERPQDRRSRSQRRPAPLKRVSSHREDLEIAIAKDQKKFGLDKLVVTTSPVTPVTPDHLDSSRTPTLDIYQVVTPTAKTYNTMSNHHSQTQNTEQGKPASTSSPNPYFPRQGNNAPTASRSRNPAPPSPLSRIQTGPGDGMSRSLPTPSSSTVASGGTNVVPQSPCFIHSHLDRTGTLQNWSQSDEINGASGSGSGNGNGNKRANGPIPSSRQGPVHPHLASSSRHTRIPVHQARQAVSQGGTLPDVRSTGSSRVTSPTNKAEASLSGYESDKSSILGGSALLDGDFMDDDDDTGSLTRQLAETAQGVREMSKQLGRTRVRSKIQTVLIVTKARDNRLIKLTRELALYLMQKRPIAPSENPNSAHSHGSSFHSKAEDRGMIVYVDAQLRHSHRFDAAGLQQDHPELFRPVHRRRSSSSASVNNLSSWSSTTSMSEAKRSKDEGQLRYWTSEMCSNSPHLFDFVVTLGGDGTVLFTSWLFQKIVPPVLPFALGSLGFLTNFDFSQYKPTMDRVIDEGIRVNLRMRFTCTVYRAIAPEEGNQASKNGKSRKAIKRPGGEILMSTVDKKGWEALEGGASATANTSSIGQAPNAPAVNKKEKQIMCFSTRPVEQFEVLNDLVVDRGPSPFVSLLELFGDEHHLTTVQADGLTVSTPTGSTAYSLSAGGSLVHPQIPALLITPICPHTLSFRPMLLPDSMELRICVPYNSRSTAWASFDGRGRVELKQGDHIKVTASKYPFPTVCADKASPDWFNAISRTLRWNEREKQKSFVVVEEDNEQEPVKKQSIRKQAENNMSSDVQTKSTIPEHTDEGQESGGQEDEAGGNEDEDESEEEEEEEVYDIDDKSGDNTPSPNTPDTSGAPPPLPDLAERARRQQSASSEKSAQSGVDTPDRFVTHCGGPPAISQRHLVDRLHAAEIEISKKDNEDGQRDNIRSDGNEMRVDGQHMIPSGRNIAGAGSSGSGVGAGAGAAGPGETRRESSRGDGRGDGGVPGPTATTTPRHKAPRARSQTRRPAPMDRTESKAKAFAFFGQDDSASDQSEDGLQ